MPYADANGIDIYYELRGEGHPPGHDHRAIRQHRLVGPDPALALAEKFQLVIFDNRGSGPQRQAQGGVFHPADGRRYGGAAALLRHRPGPCPGGLHGREDRPAAGPGLPGDGGAPGPLLHQLRREEQVATRPEISCALLGAGRKGITVEDVARSSLNLLFPQSYVRENPSRWRTSSAASRSPPRAATPSSPSWRR